MTKIRDRLFLGHEYDAHMDQIAKHRITAILNVAHDLNDPIYWEPKKALTVKVGLTDNLKNPKDMIDLAVLNLKHLMDHGHTVLVHCRAGMSRSPYIIANYLAEKEKRPVKDVWDELRALRPEVLPQSKLDPT